MNITNAKNVRWNEMELPPTKVTIWVLWWTDGSLLHGEDGFKTDLQKDEISCAKDFISNYMQTLALTCSQKKKKKKKALIKKIKLGCEN